MTPVALSQVGDELVRFHSILEDYRVRLRSKCQLIPRIFDRAHHTMHTIKLDCYLDKSTIHKEARKIFYTQRRSAFCKLFGIFSGGFDACDRATVVNPRKGYDTTTSVGKEVFSTRYITRTIMPLRHFRICPI